mmetsp:Transcript_6599/g.8040  ORF Transcript_6599/g.8040 Transcript_6599/m.8040 type:complete len:127 (-) Transcript_6599:2252-2632(-)
MDFSTGFSMECKREVESWSGSSLSPTYINFRERWKEEQKKGIQESLKASHVNVLLNQNKSFHKLHAEFHNIKETQVKILNTLDAISKEQLELRRFITSSTIQRPFFQVRTESCVIYIFQCNTVAKI